MRRLCLFTCLPLFLIFAACQSAPVNPVPAEPSAEPGHVGDLDNADISHHRTEKGVPGSYQEISRPELNASVDAKMSGDEVEVEVTYGSSGKAITYVPGRMTLTRDTLEGAKAESLKQEISQGCGEDARPIDPIPTSLLMKPGCSTVVKTRFRAPKPGPKTKDPTRFWLKDRGLDGLSAVTVEVKAKR